MVPDLSDVVCWPSVVELCLCVVLGVGPVSAGLVTFVGTLERATPFALAKTHISQAIAV